MYLLYNKNIAHERGFKKIYFILTLITLSSIFCLTSVYAAEDNYAILMNDKGEGYQVIINQEKYF